MKIASNEIKSRLNGNQGFGLQSKNYLPALNAATTAYAGQHKLNTKEAFEFYNNVLANYQGLSSVAMVSSEGFMKLDRAVINNPGVNNYNTLRLSQGYMYESDANLRGILTISANVAMGEAAGAVGTPIGQGPKGVQPRWGFAPINNAPLVEYNGGMTYIYRGGNDFKLKPGEFKVSSSPNAKFKVRGLSLTADQVKAQSFGGATKIHKIPSELEIIATPSKNDPAHFDIVPKNPNVTESEYQKLLDKINH